MSTLGRNLESKLKMKRDSYWCFNGKPEDSTFNWKNIENWNVVEIVTYGQEENPAKLFRISKKSYANNEKFDWTQWDNLEMLDQKNIFNKIILKPL